jgi:hypothetical protein
MLDGGGCQVKHGSAKFARDDDNIGHAGAGDQAYPSCLARHVRVRRESLRLTRHTVILRPAFLLHLSSPFFFGTTPCIQRLYVFGV